MPDSFLDGLYLIPVPRSQQWPDPDELLVTFVGLFDWDEISLVPESLNILSYPIHLCTAALPCSVALMGQGNSSLYLTSGGQFVCNGVDGCTSIEAHSVKIYCVSAILNTSIFHVADAAIVLSQVQVDNCRVSSDGGVVQAFKGTSVTVTDSVFKQIRSDGVGGVFSLVGSSLSLSNSIFMNCSSTLGGAISALDYQCSQSDPISSELKILNSIFESCSSEKCGGALYIGSGSTDINDSVFTECRAQKSGGSLCSEGASDSVFLTIGNCTFSENEAVDSGGGAIHAKNVSAVLAGLMFSDNKALSGGGGAVLWEVSPVTLDCGSGAYLMKSPYECKLCDAGKYQSGNGKTADTECSNCSAGSFSLPGSSFCTLCNAGKYSEVLGASSASTCLDCFEGSYQSGAGMISLSNCSLCPGGSYSTQSGASTCLSCGAGTFSTAQGSISLSACNGSCTPGSYSSSGSSSCTSCFRGTFSTGE